MIGGAPRPRRLNISVTVSELCRWTDEFMFRLVTVLTVSRLDVLILA